MIKLFFGNVQTIISTGLIVLFVFLFRDTLLKDAQITRWGTLVLRIFILGVAMSALAGVKDFSGLTAEPAIEFTPSNKVLIILSVLGVIAVLLGVGALIAKSQSTYRIIFYGLSAIIIIKIIIVELMRIIKYYTG